MPPDPEALLDERAFGDDEFLPYWAELWPSALALAEVFAGAPPARLLELGWGLGAPPRVAGLGGTGGRATDWWRAAIAVRERNAARGAATVAMRRFAWTADAAPRGTWPRVAGADVL